MPGRGGGNRKKEPHYYWNNIASIQPGARALAARLGLDFPTILFAFKSGLIYPIRRLIITGEDTSDNFSTLLGPLWESKEGKTIKQTRIDVLLSLPPSHVLSEDLDAGSPRWQPRAPDAGEIEEIEKVTEMKSKVTEQLGGRRDMETTDVREILSNFGDQWVNQLPLLQAAVNSKNRDHKMEG